jgi:hypothetical protein
MAKADVLPVEKKLETGKRISTLEESNITSFLSAGKEKRDSRITRIQKEKTKDKPIITKETNPVENKTAVLKEVKPVQKEKTKDKPIVTKETKLKEVKPLVTKEVKLLVTKETKLVEEKPAVVQKEEKKQKASPAVSISVDETKVMRTSVSSKTYSNQVQERYRAVENWVQTYTIIVNELREKLAGYEYKLDKSEKERAILKEYVNLYNLDKKD